jgi:hypothetical protein
MGLFIPFVITGRTLLSVCKNVICIAHDRL